MTKTTSKQGIPRASEGHLWQGDTLSDTLPKTGSCHRRDSTDRVSQGIPFLQKDGQGESAIEHRARGGVPPFIGNGYPGYPFPATNDTDTLPKPASKKAQRRVKRRAQVIAEWWASVPAPRPAFFTPDELINAAGLDMPRMAAALFALGWTRVYRTLNHRAGTYWLPPCSPIARWPPYTPRHFACL